MTSRADIVALALGQNGYDNGQGYDEPNKYAAFFGILGGVAYCDIFVAWVYKTAGIPLPKMGAWIASGAQYCPDSYNFYAEHGALRAGSWLAQPGDQVIFNWNGDGQPLGPESHTELVETWHNGVLYTVGGNSGPSNVDSYVGAGGVHRHAWTCPVGVGNTLIQGVGDPSAFVTFTTDEELVLTPEDKQFFAEQFAKFATKDDVSQLVKVFEDGAKNSFGMEGIKDVDRHVGEIAAHLGVKVQ